MWGALAGLLRCPLSGHAVELRVFESEAVAALVTGELAGYLSRMGQLRVMAHGNISSANASQVAADTVFAQFGTDMWEHQGRSGSTGWSHIL